MLEPMPGAPALIDYKADAKRVFDVVANGGTAIMPVTTGYALLGASRDSVMGIFNNKKRAASKVTALCGSFEMFEAVQIVGDEQRHVIDSITQFFRLPIAVIAPVRLDHPLVRRGARGHPCAEPPSGNGDDSHQRWCIGGRPSASEPEI